MKDTKKAPHVEVTYKYTCEGCSAKVTAFLPADEDKNLEEAYRGHLKLFGETLTHNWGFNADNGFVYRDMDYASGTWHQTKDEAKKMAMTVTQIIDQVKRLREETPPPEKFFLL